MAYFPRQVCEANVELIKIKLSIRHKLKEIDEKINNILNNIMAILWGSVDSIIAELMGMITSIAMSIANAIIASAASIVSSALAAIIGNILAVFMLAPDALYALAAIPKKYALDRFNKEKIEMNKMNVSLDIILSIVDKWKDSTRTIDYGTVLDDMLYNIESAKSNLNTVIEKLKDPDGSYFDQTSYDNCISAISLAIKASNPVSTLDKVLNPEAEIQKLKQLYYDVESRRIKEIYARLRKEAGVDYQETVAGYLLKDGVVMTPDMLGYHKETIDADAAYRLKIESLNNDERAELFYQESRCYARAAKDYIQQSPIVSKFKDITDEFRSDMTLLKSHLGLVAEYAAKAYLNNKLGQLIVSNIYDFKKIVNALIELIIRLVRKVGDATGNAIADTVLQTALACLKVAKEYVIKAMETSSKPSSGEGVAYPTAMATEGNITIARTTLIGASNIMAASINTKLMELINADESLTSQSKAFNDYLTRLYNIPDWDGELGVWAISPILSAKSKYTNLLTTIGKMMAACPLVLIPGPSSSSRMNNLLKLTTEIRSISSSIKTHHSQVVSVVSSYIPPQSQYVDALEKSMASSNIGIIFAIAGSMSAAFLMLGADPKQLFETEFLPCWDKWPDLYTDPEVRAEAMKNRLINIKYVPGVSVALTKKQNDYYYNHKEEIDYLQRLGQKLKLKPEDLLKYDVNPLPEDTLK